MNRKHKCLAAILVAGSLATALAAGDEDAAPTAAGATTPALAGVAAGMHFTDAQGNPRAPTAEERARLAAAFQQDLVELTRGKAIPAGSRREPNGAVSAVVGADRLQFLTATVDEAGNAVLRHRDATGQPGPVPAAASPEE